MRLGVIDLSICAILCDFFKSSTLNFVTCLSLEGWSEECLGLRILDFVYKLGVGLKLNLSVNNFFLVLILESKLFVSNEINLNVMKLEF